MKDVFLDIVVIVLILYTLRKSIPGFFCSQANLYQDRGQYKDAKDCFLKALSFEKTIQKITGEGTGVALISSNLGLLYHRQRRIHEAVSMFTAALDILGHADQSAPVYMSLGKLYLDINEFTLAENALKEALAIYSRRSQAWEATHTIARLLNLITERKRDINKASAHPNTENRLPHLQEQLQHTIRTRSLPEIISISESVVATLEANLGFDHPALIEHLLGLGLWCQEAGFPRAVTYYRRALNIAKNHFQPNDPKLAVIMTNIGSMYRKMGKLDRAQECYLKALEIDGLAYGESHPEYATDLNNLAVTYMHESKYDKAKPLLERALEIDRQTYGELHHIVAQDYQNWAGILWAEDNLQDAEKFTRIALAIFENYWPYMTLKIAPILTSLAGIKMYLGEHVEAIQLMERVLQIDQGTLGHHHIDVGNDLLIIAFAEANRGNITRAVELIPQILPFQDTLISSMMLVATEAERLSFLNELRQTVDFVLSLTRESSELISMAYQLVLRRKGLTLEVSSIQQEASLVASYPHAASIFIELNKARMKLAYQLFAIPTLHDKQTIDMQRPALDKLREQCEILERELASQVPEVKLQQQIRAANQSLIASKLPEESVLVDFIRFTPNRLGAKRGQSYQASPRYWAFILFAKKPYHVQMIDLGEVEYIDADINLFRKYVIWPHLNSLGETLEENRDHLLELCHKLYCSVFLPIKKVLGEDYSRPLFLSPDGALNLLPFEALLNKEGKFIVEEYQLSYVASGRDVLRFGEKIGEPTHTLIIADPDFDLSPEGSTTQREDRQLTLEEYLAEDVRYLSRDFYNEIVAFKRLHGTRKEAEKVTELLRKKDKSVCTWLEREALEGSLRNMHAPQILHLATHGFFEEDQEVQQEDLAIQSRSGRKRFLPPGIENPLLRSGLVLSGVNTFLRTKQLMSEIEDGILTALDVCGLNLYGTELVTLSACDTGLGKVHQGEGVFGLRRAFQQAGARTLIMSLWRVSDDETQILMEHLYRNLLSGLPKPDALRQAQLDIIQRMRDSTLQPDYGFAHPFFWAAFICQGDPAPLELDKTEH